MTTSERRWSDADRELVAEALCPGRNANAGYYHRQADAVLDALTADGWEPRCDCDGVAHDLPILRAHVRGEPGCKAASSDKGSTDA